MNAMNGKDNHKADDRLGELLRNIQEQLEKVLARLDAYKEKYPEVPECLRKYTEARDE